MYRRFVTTPIGNEACLRRWRAGRIVMRQGKLDRIERRIGSSWLPGVSIATVWYQAKYARQQEDVCLLDYHQPLGMRGVLTLDYIRSGRQTSYAGFVGACKLLDHIAKIRGSIAIVAHVSNATISDRVLKRLGWQQHLLDHPGRHWIRRFYDGYPAESIHRYLTPTGDDA